MMEASLLTTALEERIELRNKVHLSQIKVRSCDICCVSGQWSVVSGQWSVVSGQWSVVKYELFSHRNVNSIESFSAFGVNN